MTKSSLSSSSSSPRVVQVPGSPEIPNWFEKVIFTPSMHDQAHTLTSDGVCVNPFTWKTIVTNIFLNQFGILIILRWAVWRHFRLVLHVKTSPHLLQLFKRVPQCCLVVKLQSRVVDNETSTSRTKFSRSAVDDDWIFHFGWTCPLICISNLVWKS